MNSILCIDDDESTRSTVWYAFERTSTVHLAEDAKEGRGMLDRHKIDIILLDQALPGTDGLSLLEELRNAGSKIPIIMLTAVKSEKMLAEALRRGAKSVMTKPFDVHELRHLVDQTLAAEREPRTQALLRKRIDETHPERALVGASPAFQRLQRQAVDLAKLDGPVMIGGEQGSGKQAFARYLHALSTRSNEPFYVVRCNVESEASLVFDIFENPEVETRAVSVVGSGYLYFDDATKLSPTIVEKLSALMNERVRPRLVFAGLTTALPAHLAALVENRILSIPPLRERPDDIPLLTYRLLSEFRATTRSNLSEVNAEAMRLLCGYRWPGNIRELRNVIERACMLLGSEARELMPAALPREISPTIAFPTDSGKTLEQFVADYERNLIVSALAQTNGHQTRAAKLLGSTQRVIGSRIIKLNIRLPQQGKE